MGVLLALLLLLSGDAPACTQEDGTAQSVCVWSDGTGVPVLNIDHGRYWITLGGE